MEKAIEKPDTEKPQVTLSPSSPRQVLSDRATHIPCEYTIYIPSNLDLEKLMADNPPNFKTKLDRVAYICSLIYDRSYRKQKGEDKVPKAYVRLHSKILESKVKEYPKIFIYLEEQNIISIDRTSIIGKKSRGYKFQQQFWTEPKQHKIKSKVLIKAILRYKDLFKKQARNTSNTIEYHYPEHLDIWFNNLLKIDYKGAIRELNSLYLSDLKEYGEETAFLKKTSRHIPLIKLQKGIFQSTIDKTAGRYHTVLTQLKSNFRKFITYNGKKLVSIDIVNSQPLLSLALLNTDIYYRNRIDKLIKTYNDNFLQQHYYVRSFTNHKDVIEYSQSVINGTIYEDFANKLVASNLISTSLSKKEMRKVAKSAMFSCLFNRKNADYYDDRVKLFQKTYPNVYSAFKEVKRGKENHRALACTLQNFEAQLIIQTATKYLYEINNKIPLFTLHDSIITTPEYEDLVYRVMNNTIFKAMNIEPILKIESWAA
ncbi:hypothetical protein [Nonlabens xiamenensis]|uniref:hypothetical protein n=1 Tax=Nonlabens xiamenensis TaxID=2341043 RepID=UPI000F60E1CC|nr:hypothetical protein [Nonlabens xiamenensis]